jgi:dihydrofolate reductase
MLSLIVAVDDNFLIGNGNCLPWYEPTDLKYFKKITLHKAVLMGYNTYLSIINRNGKALPKRKNYVLTEEKQISGGGIIVTDLEKLLKEYQNEELFVIGGKMVYENMLPRVDKLYLTRVKGTHEGNVYFPKIPFEEFRLISQEVVENLTFEVYERL